MPIRGRAQALGGTQSEKWLRGDGRVRQHAQKAAGVVVDLSLTLTWRSRGARRSTGRRGGSAQRRGRPAPRLSWQHSRVVPHQPQSDGGEGDHDEHKPNGSRDCPPCPLLVFHWLHLTRSHLSARLARHQRGVHQAVADDRERERQARRLGGRDGQGIGTRAALGHRRERLRRGVGCRRLVKRPTAPSYMANYAMVVCGQAHDFHIFRLPTPPEDLPPPTHCGKCGDVFLIGCESCHMRYEETRRSRPKASGARVSRTVLPCALVVTRHTGWAHRRDAWHGQERPDRGRDVHRLV